MDFENLNPNFYFNPTTMQPEQYAYKSSQNQFQQSQYSEIQSNQMAYSTTNYNQMGQNPYMQQYNYNIQPQMNYQPNYNYQNQNYNQMNYNNEMVNNPTNSQFVAYGQNNVMPPQNGYDINQMNFAKPQEIPKEEEEDKVDPDFKPDEVLDEESDDEEDHAGYFCIFIEY